MKFAFVNDAKNEATKGARGVCPGCGSELIAKCGDVKINHWAHKGNRNCDPWWENETPWHRSWKNKFPVNWQEVVHFDDNGEKHIADVKTQNGWVIEFQHSYLKPEERCSRNAFYRKIIWVVDGTRRKRDVEQFDIALKKGTPLPLKSPVLGVHSEDCTLLREWSCNYAPVFFDFGVDRALWLLLNGRSNGLVYIAKIPCEYFIEIHCSGMTQKAVNFDNFMKNIDEVVAEYDSYFHNQAVRRTSSRSHIGFNQKSYRRNIRR